MPSAARRRALLAYLIVLRDRLRLQAWDLSVSPHAPLKSDTILTIAPHGARHWASVRVGTFFDEPRIEQRQTAVHELVHLWQAELWEQVDDGAIHDALHASGQGWVLQFVHDQLEVQADAAARALAPSMPMPPRWP